MAVQSARRFICQNQFGLIDDCPGASTSLLLTARHLIGIFVKNIRDVQLSENIASDELITRRLELYDSLLHREEGAPWKEFNIALQQLMNDYCPAAPRVRSETLLNAGLKYLNDLRSQALRDMMTPNAHTLMRGLEVLDLIDLGEAVKAAMDNARLKSDSTIETEVSLETGHLVMAHPIELSRAIQNLFTNASRYGRSEDGNLRLTVVVHKVGKNAELVVEDRGAGLPEDQRERVMRPFERGESARSGVTGTGLGLAIVDRIVRRSGGSVKLESAEPHGLRVRITFPAVTPKKKKAKDKEKEAPEKTEKSA